MIPRVTRLLSSNKADSSIAVPHVSWILWLILAWFALSVVTALIFGRVIRARDEREAPPSLNEGCEWMELPGPADRPRSCRGR